MRIITLIFTFIPFIGQSQIKEPELKSIDTVVYPKRACVSCPYSYDTTVYNKIDCGLFLSNKGDIAYQTIAILNDNFDKGVRYISWIYGADTTDTLGNAGLMEMRFVIDTSTFKFLSWVYWSDKNRVYGYNPMSDGGTVFYIDGADPLSFIAMGESPYAKDVNNVFYKGEPIKGADVKSFKVINDKAIPELARDKNTYYSSGKPLTKQELNEMKKR